MHTMRRLVLSATLLAVIVTVVPMGAVAATSLSGEPVAVKIAVAAPLTGGGQTYGQGMQRGTELAVRANASALASAGVSIAVAPMDDQGDPAIATANAGSIVADTSILGVVGHLNSGCSISAAPVYATANLAMVSPASSNEALTKLGLKNVFRTCATDGAQGTYAADTVVRNLRLARAFVVNDSTPYGAGLASAFAKRFVADGGKVAGTAKTESADKVFTALVTKIKAARPTVVYYGGVYNSGALLAKQLKARGVIAMFAGGDGLVASEYVTLAGKTAANGTLATSGGLPFDQMPKGSEFKAAFDAAFPGESIAPFDTYAYDAATAIIKAIIAVAQESGAQALVGTGGREAVGGKVAASQFSGVTGNVAFDSVGDTKYPAFGVLRVQSGVWRSCAQVGKPALAATVRTNRTFTVSSLLRPHHTVGSKAVVLRFWRKVGAVWMPGPVVTAVAANSGNFSRCSAKVKLAATGTWRVVATHSDGVHGSMDSVVSAFRVR